MNNIYCTLVMILDTLLGALHISSSLTCEPFEKTVMMMPVDRLRRLIPERVCIDQYHTNGKELGPEFELKLQILQRP